MDVNARRLNPQQYLMTRGRHSDTFTGHCVLKSGQPIGIGPCALGLEQSIAFAQGMLIGGNAARMGWIKTKDQPIQESPPCLWAIKKQSIHLRCQPLDMNVLGKGGLLRNGFAINMDDPPGAATFCNLTITPRPQFNRTLWCRQMCRNAPNHRTVLIWVF
jgi:hypothetical protein